MSDTEQLGLVPLGAYAFPSVPTDAVARTLIDRVRSVLGMETHREAVGDDVLERASLGVLGEVDRPPTCTPLLREMDATLAAWAAEDERPPQTRLVVLPPCDENGLLACWARGAGCDVLEPPPRASLLGAAEVPDLAAAGSGRGVLVIPRLERWFLRDRRGLDTVRALVAAVHATDRKCLLGVNSWAWRYLQAVMDVDLTLPSPLTLRAFDDERLGVWFGELAEADGSAGVRFSRVGRSDAFGLSERGEARDEVLRQLAGESLGIPWVAWRMWRAALRTRDDAADGERAEDVAGEVPGEAPDEVTHDAVRGEPGPVGRGVQERRLWIDGLNDTSLPKMRHSPDELILLQTLLLHGPLEVEMLERLVTTPQTRERVRALRAAGPLHVVAGGRVTLRPRWYPAVRRGLMSAGFPIDRL